MFDELKEYERLANVMKQALESGESQGEVTADGTTLRFQKNPRPGVRLHIEPKPGGEAAGRFEGTVYDEAPDRPQGYPSELPFLADLACMVMVVPGREDAATVQWQVEDSKATADQLARLSEAEGWVPSKQSLKAPSFLPIGLVLLERGDRTRLILHTSMGSKSVVMLIDGASR